MYIKNLELRNFRNYEFLSINFDEGYNIIYGNNAQGKTNIIEAIFLCASGRSHRTSKDAELVKNGENGYRVKLELDKEGSDSSIEMGFARNEKKKIIINDIPAKRIGDLMGQLNAVIFSPEDLYLVKEGPSERRRFLDITLSQLKPSYFYDLQQYSKILLQRNFLLKEINEKSSLLETLEVWNNHLVKVGSRIIKARSEFIGKMDKKAEERHYKLTDKKEKLGINYVPSIETRQFENIEAIEGAFRETLRASAKKELLKGITLYGPHRDDYDIILNEMSTKQFGSQGQQRTSVLSIKLAEIDILKEENGDYPVLLLDDVMSELDNSRQEYLFGNIGNIQTFITCTDRQLFGNKGANASYFHVVKGEVMRQ